MLSQTEEDGRVAAEIEGKKAEKQTEKGGRDGRDTSEKYHKKKKTATNPKILLFISLFNLKPIPVLLEVCVTGAERSKYNVGQMRIQTDVEPLMEINCFRIEAMNPPQAPAG